MANNRPMGSEDKIQKEWMPVVTIVPVSTVVPKEKEFNCDVCNKIFSKRFNLHRHLKTMHPVWLASKPKTYLQKPKRHPCDVCNKLFLKPNYLLSHKRKIHKIEPIKIRCESSIRCHVCERSFSTNFSLKRHLNFTHAIATQVKKTLKCSECPLSCQSRAKFLEHVYKSHGISASIENLYFSTEEEFDKWRVEIEKKSFSKFIKRHTYSVLGKQVMSFLCHRNGHYKNKSTGKRRTKVGGTNKIKYFCPANIFVQSESPSNVFPAHVKYCSTHLGHTCEAGRIPLDKQKKDELVDQILGFMGKLQQFGSKKQCTEILKTLSELKNKCEAMEKSNTCKNSIQSNENKLQCKFSAKKNIKSKQ